MSWRPACSSRQPRTCDGFMAQPAKSNGSFTYDAHSWVMSDDYSWPFSFPNVCRLLNRVPDELRQELVGDLAFGHFGQLDPPL